ncbi:MAG: YraN family protein [Amphiplicatus sp.]
MDAATRAKAEKGGRRAEFLAALFLQFKGFSIIARRFRSSAGEIDIAARRGKLVILAEVKARASFESAVLAVTPRARKRIEAAGRTFLSRQRGLEDCALRYDIIAVSGWRIRHLPDAWRESDR